MIRIDEIYDLVLWPWIKQNRGGVRMFYFDPFGATGIDAVKSMPMDHAHEHNYIIFFDQEPINLVRHAATMDHIQQLECMYNGPESPRLVTSERDSTEVQEVCDRYGFDALYYFFHGWAALDWYRGYNRCGLLQAPAQRRITTTFMSPNRIVGGERWHRVVMFYHMVRLGLIHNHISMPECCPVEGELTGHIAERFQERYPDISSVLGARKIFPRHLPGETDYPMSSYRLDQWHSANESLVYVVTETVAHGQRHHLTEKIFKPIALGMPFMLLSTANSLAYLRSYGFKTFGDFWDESYDKEPDTCRRAEMIAQQLYRLDRLDHSAKNDLWHSMLNVINHNRSHFYGGGFESRLDTELKAMLCQI